MQVHLDDIIDNNLIMKKTLTVLILSTLSALAMASGSHSGGHQVKAGTMMQEHDMSGMEVGSPAVGQPGDGAQVTRTVDIVMDDTMRFTPDDIHVKAGDTVRFLIKNVGKLPHELVIGSVAEMRDHAAMMRKMPDVQHAEPNMISLNPDQAGELVWQFTHAGTVDFACLIAGHMEAGMVGKVMVG